MKALWNPRRLGDEKGAAAVEFVLVLPVLLILLMGIIQFGALLYTQNYMINTARETARRMAVAEITAAEAETLALVILDDAAGLRYTVIATEPVDPDVDTDVIVNITIPMSDAAILGFPLSFADQTLTAEITMRQEG